MSEETPQERQDNEFEVLKSMFCEDIVDNRENIAWKVWRPLDVLLTLYPHRTSSVGENHCSITLNIKCCSDYPNKPPAISIHKLQGLSNENAAKLLQQLEKLAEHSCGEVMIYNIAEHVQSFLVPFNKPTLSFYDEMMEQQNLKKKIQQLDKESEGNYEQRQKIKEEIERRQQLLRNAGRQRPNCSISQHSENNDVENDGPELVYFADKKPATKKVNRSRNSGACACNSKGIQILRISHKNNKKVHVGKCLGHSSNGATTYLAIDAESGDYIVTKKWFLNPASDFQTRNRQLTLIEQDLKAMCRLKHPSIIPYTAMETQQEMSKKNSYQCVYIFRDFVQGCSLRDMKKQLCYSDGSKALGLMRHVGLGVLSALNELHCDGVLHRDVRCENVFLDGSGAVKLVGASLDCRLADILEEEDYSERQTKAHDIYATAQLLLSLVSCSEDDGLVSAVPSHLPNSAKDFFQRCLTEDEYLQWSAEQLMKHGFLMDSPACTLDTRQRDHGDSGSEEEDKKLVQSLVLNASSNATSRLTAEFEVLKWLGKGAFGDVLKVRNKLDGGSYAIKRIKLNPENVHLNKKITREVKLLSRLNHENVVRYYNAWIETMHTPNDDSMSETDCSAVKESQTRSPAKTAKPSLDAVVAKLTVPGVKLEWSISNGPVHGANDKSESDDEEDIDEDDDDDDEVAREWCRITSSKRQAEDTSSSIAFEDTTNQSETLPSAESAEDGRATPAPSRARADLIKQVLFIQMEFCEKNTLRHAIDNGLYMENFRIWKLFREIVNGLSHIHQEGMIHRDLKPVNIFLDSHDHVKIGDFGLATKAFNVLPVTADDKDKHIDDMVGGSLTGQVGTALYVAPELLQATNKIIYNQKVDLYSLGIILFEMVHPPLATGMERIRVLTDLRQKDILMPESFVRSDNDKLIIVIKWLLDHEPSKRPSCTELLSSEHVPRPMHGPALTGQLSYTLTAKGSREYKRLVTACLDQTLSPAEDFTYQAEWKKPDSMLQLFKNSVTKVFRSHGATEFSPPLLQPRAKGWEHNATAVRLMTASGFVCHLPHDLRLPFARHVAYTRTRNMRRYTVERVFREKHAEGFHPREIIECAFDIVTPRTGTLWPDAEVIVVAGKAAAAVNLKVVITLNHTEMLKIILLGCGIAEDKHRDVYPILVDVRIGRIANLQLKTHLSSLCITDDNVIRLMKLMESEVPLPQMRDLMAQFAFKRDESRKLAAIIADIEAVIKKAEALGLECATTISPCLSYNATQHSGVFWQMYAMYGEHRPAARHRAADLIATGGRYDALVDEFCQFANMEECDVTQAGVVGFSMSLVRMLSLHKKLKIEPPPIKPIESTKICVCIKSTEGASRQASPPRIARLARDLWTADYTVCTCESHGASEAHELTEASIVLMDDLVSICVFFWDDTRVREHRLPFIEVVDFVKQKLNSDSIRSPEGGANRTVSWSEDRNEKLSGANITVHFVAISEKMTKNARRQCENQINSQITSSLSRLGLSSVLSRCRVLAVALGCTADCVRMFSALLEAPLLPAALPPAVRALQESFPRRRKMLDETLEELTAILTSQSNQPRSSDDILIYALYSIPDSVCRIIT